MVAGFGVSADAIRRAHALSAAPLAGFDPPAVHGTWADTLTVLGRQWTTTFDSHPDSRQLTLRSPMGRYTYAWLDAAGRPTSVRVPGLARVEHAYDGHGRLTGTRQGARAWRYAYDDSGRVAAVTDTLGRTMAFRYDAADRLVRQELADSARVTYRYDARGDLAALKPPGRDEHGFGSTPRGQTRAYDPPDVGGADTTHYGYDGDRLLTVIQRPDGRTVELTYESGNERLDYLEIGRGAVDVSYDATRGTVSSITSPDTVTCAYSYDGPLPLTESWSGVVAGSVSVTYDTSFAVASQTVNGGSAVSFGYDNDWLLTHAGALSIDRSDSNGTVTAATLGNVVMRPYLNAYGEPDSVVTQVAGVTRYRASYGRDGLGRSTTLSELLPDSSHVWEYGYDLRGRLATVHRDGAWVAHYLYDANGNRTSVTGASAADTATATYDAQDRLVRYRDTRYEYSAVGELRLKIEPHLNPGDGPEPFWESDTTWWPRCQMVRIRMSTVIPTLWATGMPTV